MFAKKQFTYKNKYDVELAVYSMPAKLYIIPTIEITWSKDYFNLQIELNIFNICFSFGADNYDCYYLQKHKEFTK